MSKERDEEIQRLTKRLIDVQKKREEEAKKRKKKRPEREKSEKLRGGLEELKKDQETGSDVMAEGPQKDQKSPEDQISEKE